MWFRNLQLYRLLETPELEPEALETRLAEHAFQPCGGLDTHRVGWDAPLGRRGRQLQHITQGRVMLCLRREDRLLPATVVREALEEKVEEIEQREGRPVGRKEKTRLKDEIVVDLLPRAFTRSQRLYAYIDPRADLIVVDAATPRKAEELLNLLRDTLGSLRVQPLRVSQSPARVMTQWAEGRAPADFVPGDECELKEPVDNGAVIRARKLDLSGDDIQGHLEHGMQVTRLAVEWKDRLRCVLGDDLVIRRLRFTDGVMEAAAEVDAEDAAARFDADFALMSGELADFIPRLIEVFGGEDRAD
jgi:recombination associated protein RdgC